MHFTCENALIVDFLEFCKNFHLPPSLPPGKNLPILLRNLKTKIYKEYFGHKKRFFKQKLIAILSLNVIKNHRIAYFLKRM